MCHMQITFFSVINLFHCDKCGCCYNNVMKDSHCCVKRAMHPNCTVCFEEHEKAAKAEARGNEQEVPAKRNDDRMIDKSSMRNIGQPRHEPSRVVTAALLMHLRHELREGVAVLGG
ncbi:uncharacterized protein [Miscanthus floridulus]|uniref:uncharacterized protein isoform X2 n=1 Tax=Miscanthus floridulus TaxID=154761 RepID=UPI003458CD85